MHIVVLHNSAIIIAVIRIRADVHQVVSLGGELCESVGWIRASPSSSTERVGRKSVWIKGGLIDVIGGRARWAGFEIHTISRGTWRMLLITGVTVR
jgi:hypothetical protein